MKLLGAGFAKIVIDVLFGVALVAVTVVTIPDCLTVNPLEAERVIPKNLGVTPLARRAPLPLNREKASFIVVEPTSLSVNCVLPVAVFGSLPLTSLPAAIVPSAVW